MTAYLPRADTVLKRLDQFLAQFATMINQQQAMASNLPSSEADALLKQMLHAQGVVEDRRRDLRDALTSRALERFVHELWGLVGDMSHFDFDVSHLASADAFQQARQEISLDALVLTKDLSTTAAQADLAAELAGTP
jgi:hypothetical protein